VSAVEEIQAAIDKLTTQKDNSTPGAWARSAAELDQPGFVLSPRTCAGCGGDFPLEELDVELIATLHRTIDAQLGILQEAIFQLSDAPLAHGFHGHEFNIIMALARAINGVTS